MEALFLDNYWVKSEIGSGSTGTFFHAVNTVTGNEVTLKKIKLPPVLLSSQRQEQFGKYEQKYIEAQKLDHPGIVKIYSFFREKDLFLLETEYVRGKNLAEIIAEGAGLKFGEAVHIFLKAAESLSYAHKNGVLHGYLRPSSVLVTREGAVKLTGFGDLMLNKMEEQKELDSSVPDREIAYYSPEQLKNGTVSESGDIYSLAAVMYEMFTGKPPYTGFTREEQEDAIAGRELEAPRNLNPLIPEMLNYILIKSLDRNPELRHSSVDELTRDLNFLINSGKIEDKPVSPGTVKKIKGRFSGTVESVRKNVRKFVKSIKGEGDIRGQEGFAEKLLSRDNVQISEEDMESLKKLGELSSQQLASLVQTMPEKEMPVPIPGEVPAEESKIPPYFTTLMASLFVIVILIFAIPWIAGRKNSASTVVETPSAAPVASDGKSQVGNDYSLVTENSAGRLFVTCNEDNVEISVSNYENQQDVPVKKVTGKAKTSMSFDLKPGVYSLQAHKPHFNPYEARLEMMEGQNKIVNVEIEKKMPRLEVVTFPAGAEVYLNSSFYGKTPLSLYDVRFGKYKMQIKREDYKICEENIEVKQDGPTFVNKRLSLAKEVPAKPAPSPSPKKGAKNKPEAPVITLTPKYPESNKPSPEGFDERNPYAETAKNPVKVAVEIRLGDASVIERSKNRTIILSYNQEQISDYLFGNLTAIPGVHVVDTPGDADVIVKIQFNVETIGFRGSSKTELALNSEITATDVKRNIIIMRGSEKLPLSAIEEGSLEKAPVGTPARTSRSFINRDATTPAVRAFLDKQLEFLSKVLKIYSSDKREK
ncbi:MAG: protein kinase [Firmicutes bacterium]|nr:protein kinase [Bacillota bacterium]